ncbi:unnamed protein product, partial [Heterosigma akashiwo]
GVGAGGPGPGRAAGSGRAHSGLASVRRCHQWPVAASHLTLGAGASIQAQRVTASGGEPFHLMITTIIMMSGKSKAW